MGRCPAVLALAVLLATVAGAQSDPGRLTGSVTGPDEKPLPDATVRVFPQGDPGTGPPSVRTDSRGRWSVVGLAPGRWQIEIEAVGFIKAEGWVQVLSGAASPPVEVELRSLTEGTPRFSEGSPSTLRRWIEAGNALLAQGHPTRARREFDKALRALPRQERPQILQAIARTHFLEGDTEAAVAALTRALRIEPGNDDLRALFGALLGELGREQEVAVRLAEIETQGPADEEVESARAPRAPVVERRPIDEPRPGRTGQYRTRLAERSPLSAIEIYLERFGLTRDQIAAVDEAVGAYDLTVESYEVFVPERVPDGGYGLFVWISPTPYGGFSTEGAAAVLSQRGLIWVGADNAGNGRRAWYRVALALDAVHNLRRLYEIDPNRVYVGGYSGGGRVSSAMVLLYSEVFRGGLFNYGCDYFKPLRVPDKPGARWPAKFPEPQREVLERVRRESRLVYLTGERDFNRAQTKATWKQAVADGFTRLAYLEIPGADHYSGVDPEWLERAFAALDGDEPGPPAVTRSSSG